MAENLGQDSRADAVIKRADQLKGNRSNWESHWEEVAERVWPSYSTLFEAGNYADVSKGEKRTQEQFDSTASIALTRFASAMESMLTPRNGIWHQLNATNPDLMKMREVRLWFDEVNRLLFKYRYMPNANFASQIHEIYMSLGAFGTGSMFIDDMMVKGRKNGIRYKSMFLGEVFFCVNHQGVVDTVYRRFPMTVRQMIQQFGDQVPKSIAENADNNPDKNYEVIHCIRPNEEMDSSRADFKGMPFRSIYVSVEGRAVLREGGYETFPMPVSRHVTTPGELYGRSPAMQVLPAIKTLNAEKKTVLKQGQRIVDPVLLAYDDGVLDSFSMAPGALNYGGVNEQGRSLIQTLPTGSLAIANEMMNDERAVINDAFLVTLFQILVDTPQMTATEVMERAREKGALLAPTMGRQQSELLGPMIERELDVLSRQGKLPPMPQVLIEAEGEYKIEYDSPLSRAQKAESGAGTMRTIQWAAEIAAQAQDPSAMDWFNFDEIVPYLADVNAMPVRFLTSEDDVKKKRQGRQQQAETQQLIDAGPSMAAMMKSGVGAAT